MASPRPGISKQNFHEVWTPAPLLTANMEGGTTPHMTASSVIQKLGSFFPPDEGAEGKYWIGASRGSISGPELVAALEHREPGPQSSPFTSLTVQ
jgi:hypothetical protein